MTHYQIERNHDCRVSDAWTFRGLKTAIIENEVLRFSWSPGSASRPR